MSITTATRAKIAPRTTTAEVGMGTPKLVYTIFTPNLYRYIDLNISL